MAFIIEPTAYHKTVLSDLQGAFGALRESVVENFGFSDSDKLLFHIDEAMSWESVRNLKHMKETFLLIQNISVQSKAPNDIIKMVDEEIAINYREYCYVYLIFYTEETDSENELIGL